MLFNLQRSIRQLLPATPQNFIEVTSEKYCERTESLTIKDYGHKRRSEQREKEVENENESRGTPRQRSLSRLGASVTWLRYPLSIAGWLPGRSYFQHRIAGLKRRELG